MSLCHSSSVFRCCFYGRSKKCVHKVLARCLFADLLIFMKFLRQGYTLSLKWQTAAKTFLAFTEFYFRHKNIFLQLKVTVSNTNLRTTAKERILVERNVDVLVQYSIIQYGVVQFSVVKHNVAQNTIVHRIWFNIIYKYLMLMSAIVWLISYWTYATYTATNRLKSSPGFNHFHNQFNRQLSISIFYILILFIMFTVIICFLSFFLLSMFVSHCFYVNIAFTL